MSPGRILATAPAHAAGSVDVTVTTAGGPSAIGVSDQYTYLALPAVASVGPASGPAAGGTLVTIRGSGFSGARAVTFGGLAATGFTVVDADHITATAPSHSAGPVDVRVTTPLGTSATDARDGYLYVAAPAVAAVGPAGGSTAGGTLVTITGTSLEGATAVRFGGTSASGFSLVNPDRIMATAPAHAAGAVDVTVTTAGGTSATGAADRFTYSAVPTETVLYRFTGRRDGAHPTAPLTLEATGALAGRTGNGTSFQLAPGAGGWHLVLLPVPAGPPDAAALSPLVANNAGSLYGTAAPAGSEGGAVLRFDPPRRAGGAWSRTVLYRFRDGAEGAASGNALLLGEAGMLYGTSTGGGAGFGTVFALTPPGEGRQDWTRTVLHVFRGGAADGADPASPLLGDGTGALYGTTLAGGSCALAPAGCGTVYRLIRRSSGWAETVLHRFAAGVDGAYPAGPLALDQDGALYGATRRGGPLGRGTVFRLAPAATGWIESVLHPFLGGRDGEEPEGGVILDDTGALYGATRFGGVPGIDAGTVYRIGR